MSKNTIEQTVEFNASAHVVYELLMDEKKHSEFTNAPASISRKAGGEFSVWDGYAVGDNIELIPDKKIVQNWRASDWPAGEESKITFELHDKNGNCELVFTQSRVPDDYVEEISKGWQDNYWDLMKRYLAEH